MYIVQLFVALGSLYDKKLRKMWHGEKEAVRTLRSQVDPNARYIWFHAASLGEFEQGRPLIEEIRQLHPEYKILLTFFSPSGYEVRKDYKGADIITYLPIDTVGNARRFLRAIRPEIAFFIKYEFWYNYLHILQHRGVPIYSVSSIFRPKQIFFRWYGRGYGRVLKCITSFFVQNEESRKLLEHIGIKNAIVVGDTRFDRVLQIKRASKQLPLLDGFVKTAKTENKKVFVAGSSWQPDEEIFLKYFNEHNDWKLIIAPHVVEESHLEQIESIIKNKKVVRYTQVSEAEIAKADVLIIDCYGLLSSIYKYGDIAYVGGGFGVGIHNVLEAAVWDMPVVFGPNNKHFAEAQGLLKEGGGFEIFDIESFTLIMNQLVEDVDYRQTCGSLAGTFVQSLAGATDKILGNVDL